MKKFLCSVLVAVLALSLGTCAWSADYWDEHTGSEGDPYVIDSNADLIALRDRVNVGTEAADKYYRLTENLTISSITDWAPIGVDDSPFKGHFDGNNKAIQINITSASNWRGGDSQYYQHSRNGLFGVVASSGYAIKISV